MQSTIIIELDGVSLTQTEYVRRIVHLLLTQGVFNMRNGKVILHFDHEGALQLIEKDFISWKKGAPEMALAELFKHAKVLIA